MDGHDTFSVGIMPATDDLRRELLDGIAKLAGWEDRRGHHVETFQRLVTVTHQWMTDAPESFAQLFGEGVARQNAQFFAYAKRVKAAQDAEEAGRAAPPN